MRNVIASCAALAACFAGGSAAIAATATATSTATLTVSDANACSVTGGSINLGSFKSTDTLLTVYNKLGGVNYDVDGSQFRSGTDGPAAMKLATVNCLNGINYVYTTNGGNNFQDIDFVVGNGKKIYMYVLVKKVGSVTLPDTNSGMGGLGVHANPFWGDLVGGGARVRGTGTGQAQDIMGSVVPYVGLNQAAPYLSTNDALGPVGSYSASFTSTVTF